RNDILPPRHCERSEAIHNLAYINFCNGILKEVHYYRFALKRVKMLRICTPRKFCKFSRNDREAKRNDKVETLFYNQKQ
ncbi:hypothetical protein, partial [Helicobacter rodentium]|uniref:hypothetical protein n=1 Tax=Helicobacter rodentium TaxID=59617 RepID=UPI0025B75AB9